jgi:hypothetical protein
MNGMFGSTTHGLAGLAGNEGMFEGFNGGFESMQTPSAKDIEDAEEAIRFQKTVLIDQVCVETYDLGDPKDVKRYIKDRKAIMDGVMRRTTMLIYSDKRFVESKCSYIAHMEWHVYKLIVKEHGKAE